MPALRDDIDPQGLLEYSVVYTDRALNHMSAEFQNVMKELSTTLKGLYHADSVAIIPSSGTSGMEAVARQLATDKNVVVVRNGWFSHRWVQILEQGRIANTTHVFNAQIHEGLSSTPCCGLVMMSERAKELVQSSESTSFALDLKAWANIMTAYENGGHAYHATMPTDGLRQLRDTLNECQAMGFDKLKSAQIELGCAVLQVLNDKGVISVADKDSQAMSVIVCHAPNDDIHKGVAFAKVGVQIAGGVPLQVGEPSDYKSFRIGLFGLDKLSDVSGTVARFRQACDKIF